MKRFSDAAREVTGAVSGGASAPTAVPELASRPPLACWVAGCPMPGTISDSTLGAGPWECRWHKFRSPDMTADEVTLRLRNRLADGRPIDEAPGPSQAALDLRTRVRRDTAPERVPGEDDE